MSPVYVGNLDPRVTKRDLEDEFRTYGVIRSIWVARRPLGYAFIDFDDRRDAQDAICDLDGKHGWRIELSHNCKDRGRGGRGGRDRGGQHKTFSGGHPRNSYSHSSTALVPSSDHLSLNSYRSPNIDSIAEQFERFIASQFQFQSQSQPHPLSQPYATSVPFTSGSKIQENDWDRP
ncbi:serine/arginine-rich splicing factor RSZ22A-like [Asparagus officinalis]|uniref:serine/arginine-rich splicing factor RSZ22A-like n=1 Tax=Asparagus officinalis TaxID=4686 RepID=UPI00098E1605|nr:serine/arginine-rich splicing factor RSZ22A-like [Asparagus officinalis]XP_020255502.1 serine/arginine-rich splicing factor RSZ22A-like [Asparagus officinalis]